MKNLLRFIRFLLLFARLFADDDGFLNPVQEAAAPEKYVVGDLGSVIQLAVKSSVGEALQEQKKTNEGLQVELRDLRRRRDLRRDRPPRVGVRAPIGNP